MGGIQVYLWELWSRLDPESFAVLTASSHPDAEAFDASQALRGTQIHRVRSPVLLPTPELARRVRRLAAEIDAGLVLIDPALPLGLIGPALGVPYGVILHGAEIAAPGRLPLARERHAFGARSIRPRSLCGRLPGRRGSASRRSGRRKRRPLE